MKKIVVIIMVFAFMPFVATNAKKSQNTSKQDLTEFSIKYNDEWTPVGTTEIVKKVGAKNAAVTQIVQVYENSDGIRAIKDKKMGYQKFKENNMYQRWPADECFECGYQYMVFYEGGFWYTKGIVK